MENNGKFIFIVKADVCTANGKDVNATKILEVMKTYGTVEDYETHIKALRSEDKKTIDNLVAQVEAIKSQNLTADEIELINVYRKLIAASNKVHIDEKETLRKQLDDVYAENEERNAAIAALIGRK